MEDTDARQDLVNALTSSLNAARVNDPIDNYCSALADRMREMSQLDLCMLRCTIDHEVNTLLLAAARAAQQPSQRDEYPQYTQM